MPHSIVRGILLLTENHLLPAVLAVNRPLDDLTNCSPRSVSRRLLVEKARWASCWPLMVVKFI